MGDTEFLVSSKPSPGLPVLPPAAGYSMAVALVGVALVVRRLLDPLWHDHYVYIAFFPAVVAIIFMAGRGPSLLSLALSILVADFFFISPRYDFAIPSAPELAAAGLFLASGLAVLLFAERVRAASGRERAALEALHRSELRWRTLGEAAFEGLATTEEGVIKDCNEQFASLLGATREQVIGTQVREWVPPEQWPAIAENIAAGRESLTEHAVIARDGSRRWVEAHGKTIDLGGRRVRFTGMRDVTTRKNVEQTLRDNEARLQSLVTDLQASEEKLRQTSERLGFHMEHSPLAVIEFDRDLRITFWSTGAAKVFGWEPAEILGKCMWEVPWVFEDDVPAVKAVSAALLKGEPQRVSPNRNLRKDGSVIWCEWYNSSLVDSSGQMQSIFSLVLDVTPRVMAEQALRIGEERLDLAVNVAGLGVFDHDHRSDSLAWSPELRRMYGVPEEAPASLKAFLECVHPEDRQSIARAIVQAHDPTGDGRYAVEHRVVWGDGTVRWLLQRARTFFEGVGKQRRPVRTVGAVVDVTDAKLAEDRLRRSERLYRAIGESIEYGVWVCAPDGRNVYASDSFLKLVGLTQEQCSNFGWGDVLHPDDAERTVAAWKECVRAGGTWDIEHRYLGVDGQYHQVLARGLPVKDEDGTVLCWAGINLDISRLKRVEDELRQAQENLAQANRELEQRVLDRTVALQETTNQLNAFVYTLAHDLRAPLRAQVAFATILLEDFGPQLGATGTDYLRRIADSAERQGVLLTDLLKHISLSRADLPLEPVDLVAAIKQAQTDLVLEVQQKHARIALQEVHGEVLANPASLHLVITNLLSNALKFVSPGVTPEIRLWTEPAACSSNGTELKTIPAIRLWVEDNGIGIPTEHRARLFGIFERLHPGTAYPGTGIGLAIVKKAIERMGGHTGVESEPGKGSRFWVELRAVATDGPSQP